MKSLIELILTLLAVLFMASVWITIICAPIALVGFIFYQIIKLFI